jgi:hypothetical protein
MGSDNPAGADNQQERLIEFRGWVIGFVDGEGCFSVGFARQSGGKGRRGYRTGWQVAHEFAVPQGASSIQCLHELREYFEVGAVIANRRSDNHREHLHRYVVRRREDLSERIIPFFEVHPLRTSKRQNFEKFAQIAQMNRRKPRHELIRILRDHTPEIQDTGS